GGDLFYLSSDGGDTINGGSGSDAIDASGLTHGVTVHLWNRVFGTGGYDNDITGIEIVYGTASGDVFWSANNINDTFYGGDGSDTFYIGNNGGDYRDGEGGADWITAANRNGGVNINFSANKSTNEDGDEDTLHNIEHAIGSGFNDTITGDLNNNQLYGGAGDDQLLGGGGDDTLDGGGGSDTLTGGGGGDLFYLSSDGGDTINGGSGSDAIDASGLTHGVTVHLWNRVFGTGGYDNDITGIEIVYGTDFDDVFWSAININDTFYGGEGSDTFYVGSNGGDYRDGGAGDDNDWITAANRNGGVNINFSANKSTNEDGDEDTLHNIEHAIGSGFNDTITGDLNNNQLYGGAGDDQLLGGNGADTLDGGSGNDTMTGGAGLDSFVFDNAAGEGDDVIVDFNTTDDTISVSGELIADLVASAANDGNGDAVITHAGGAITLLGVDASQVIGSMFV
ncbi:MAG: calcium-binding protein, partial [Alphaproteobacteria bacterium]|nr:calcium-binding protein [Alphaproteobacteria bacterium SS10]